MMKKLIIVTFAGLVLLLGACENEISYRTDEFAPKLTLNSFMYADSLTQRLYLSFTGRMHLSPVEEDATVEVRVNGELKEVLHPTPVSSSEYQYVDITSRFRPGDVVRIDARTADGNHHAWVEETVPYPVEILQIDTSIVENPAQPYEYAYKPMRIKIRLKDRPNEKNYYRIVIEHRETVKGVDIGGEEFVYAFVYHNFWPWDDIALTDGRPITSTEQLDTELFERMTNFYGIFDDSWFKDSEYTVNVQVGVSGNYYNSDQELIPQTLDVALAVRLLTITEIEFYYLNTMNLIDSGVLEEYLNDPVKIPSNVHGGTGFVGISAEYSEIIQVVEGKEIEPIEFTDTF